MRYHPRDLKLDSALGVFDYSPTGSAFDDDPGLRGYCPDVFPFPGISRRYWRVDQEEWLGGRLCAM